MLRINIVLSHSTPGSHNSHWWKKFCVQISRILPAFVRGPQNNQDIFKPDLTNFCANKIRQSIYGSSWLHVTIQNLINTFSEKYITRRRANETFQQKSLNTKGICILYFTNCKWKVYWQQRVSEWMSDLTYPIPLSWVDIYIYIEIKILHIFSLYIFAKWNETKKWTRQNGLFWAHVELNYLSFHKKRAFIIHYCWVFMVFFFHA